MTTVEDTTQEGGHGGMDQVSEGLKGKQAFNQDILLHHRGEWAGAGGSTRQYHVRWMKHRKRKINE